MKIERKTMTTDEIVTMLESLEEFDQKDIRMPIVLSWALEDNLESLKKIKDKYLKSRAKIELEFVEDKKVNEGTTKIKEEFLVEFRDRLSELLLIENTLDIQMVPFSLLEGREFSSKEIRAIKFMIDREETNNENVADSE